MDKQIGFSFHQKGSGANKMHQIHFRPGLRPGPRWGSSRRSPDPLVGWGRGYPLPIPHPLDAYGVSISAPRLEPPCYTLPL